MLKNGGIGVAAYSQLCVQFVKFDSNKVVPTPQDIKQAVEGVLLEIKNHISNGINMLDRLHEEILRNIDINAKDQLLISIFFINFLIPVIEKAGGKTMSEELKKSVTENETPPGNSSIEQIVKDIVDILKDNASSMDTLI